MGDILTMAALGLFAVAIAAYGMIGLAMPLFWALGSFGGTCG